MKKLYVILAFLLCLLPSVHTFAKPNSSRGTIYVDDDNTQGPWDGSLEHPYQHIQDAVDNASNGDMVFVSSGNYNENVNVTKSISLIGENKNDTIIKYDKMGEEAVSLYSNNVILSNFSVNNSKGFGIDFRRASGCKIDGNNIQAKLGILIGSRNESSSNDNEVCNNNITSIFFSIQIGWMAHETRHNFIHRNRFTNLGEGEPPNAGILLGDTAVQNIISDNLFIDCHSVSILSYESKDNIIERNIIDGNMINGDLSNTGISMSWTFEPAYEGNIIRENIIRNCGGDGIDTSTDGHSIENNTIENCTCGLSLNFGPHNIVVRSNTIKFCYTGQNTWYADRGTIFEENLYESNHYAVVVDYSKNLTYFKNVFKDNGLGILCLQSSKCEFIRNIFQENKINVFAYYSRCHWQKNYWDRPRPFPKPIFGIFPLLQFDWTPALQSPCVDSRQIKLS
jgi:nitrous oxidase accessory protein NosD